MYSVVLMAAMVGGGEVADLGHRRGHGCRGGCYGGCYGGGWGGCYGGYGMGYGCYGGGWGGCYGGGYGGGYGGCYGGWGMGYGCYGSGYSYGGMGYGCYGGYGGYGGCYGGGMMYGTPVYGTPAGGGEKLPKPKSGDEGQINAPATLVVSLPADARLTVDGSPTASTGSVRVFSTPELRPGKTYSYRLKAELNRNGKPVTWEEKVTVQAGQRTEVNLSPPAGVARR